MVILLASEYIFYILCFNTTLPPWFHEAHVVMILYVCMLGQCGCVEHRLTLLALTALEQSPAMSHVNRCVRCWHFFLPSCLASNQQINQAKPDQVFSTLLLSAHQAQNRPFVSTPTDPTGLVFRPARRAQGRAKNGNKLDTFLCQLLSERPCELS